MRHQLHTEEFRQKEMKEIFAALFGLLSITLTIYFAIIAWNTPTDWSKQIPAAVPIWFINIIAAVLIWFVICPTK